MALQRGNRPAVNITGKIVQVVVGPDEITYNLHENLVRSRSPFFEAALSKSWRERNEGCINLPDDDPEVVELYIQYLYSDRLPIAWTENTSDIRAHENLPEYFTLAHMYVFGEKIRDIDFKNAVIDAFVKRMSLKARDGVRWSPVGEVVNIIYRGTLPESPARSLMLDCHYWKARENWIDEHPDSNNIEFLIALSRRLLRDRERKRPPPSLPSNPFEGAIETRLYHEDADGRPVRSL